MSDMEVNKHPQRMISYQSELYNTDTELEPLEDINTSLQDIAAKSLMHAFSPKHMMKEYEDDRNRSPPISDIQIHRPEPIRWRINPDQRSSGYGDNMIQSPRKRLDSMSTDDEEPTSNQSYNRSRTARQNLRSVKTPKANSEETSLNLKSKDKPNDKSAFTSVSPSNTKRVNFAKRKKKKKAHKDLPPSILTPGAIDLSRYSVTAKLWLEQVDIRTVEKSRDMYMAVMREGEEPPSHVRNRRPLDSHSSPDRSQWVIARGKSLRKAKQMSQAKSDTEDQRPMSPSAKNVVLFFKVGSKWKDLAWVLFESILTESETVRLIKDIEIKNRSQRNSEIQDLLNRWWVKKGASATIDELKSSLDLVNMPYIQDETVNDYFSHESEFDDDDELDISEIDENDPNVSRYIEEYDIRSLNNSFDLNTSGLDRATSASLVSPIHSPQLSATNLSNRLAEKGLLASDGSLGRSPKDRSIQTLSSLSSTEPVAPVYHSTPTYHSTDLDISRESRQAAFVITQPQLANVDVSQL